MPDPGNDDFETLARKIVTQLLDPECDGSLQIDALAGTGKTFLTNWVIKILEEQNISYLAMAPTHVAAQLLGTKTKGKTMQSSLSVLKHGNAAALSHHKVIILDEKSMISELNIAAMCMLKENSQVRFMIVGCWDQLPPVADRCATFDYEHSTAIHSLCGGRMLKLTKCRRSDTRLYDQYKDVNNIDLSLFGQKELDTSCCFYNRTAWRQNEKWMLHHRLERRKKIATSKDAQKLLKTQDLILFDNLYLMSVVSRS
jgi:hypothetical protein